MRMRLPLSGAGLAQDWRRLAQIALRQSSVFAAVRQLGASPSGDASKLSWRHPCPQLALGQPQ